MVTIFDCCVSFPCPSIDILFLHIRADDTDSWGLIAVSCRVHVGCCLGRHSLPWSESSSGLACKRELVSTLLSFWSTVSQLIAVPRLFVKWLVALPWQTNPRAKKTVLLVVVPTGNSTVAPNAPSRRGLGFDALARGAAFHLHGLGRHFGPSRGSRISFQRF